MIMIFITIEMMLITAIIIIIGTFMMHPFSFFQHHKEISQLHVWMTFSFIVVRYDTLLLSALNYNHWSS